MFTKRRMNRIFRPDGRSLIVAMDHVGFMNKPLPGLMRANETIRDCVANGADAIMTTFGTASACLNEIGDAGLILTISSFERPAIDLAVENALRLGADAVKVLVYPFQSHVMSASGSIQTLGGVELNIHQSPSQPEPSMLNLTWLGAQCTAWGMPLLAETIPGGWTAGPDMRTPEVLAAGARVGVEAGADFIKTFATSEPEKFRVVADNCPAPVVILGGEKAGSDRDLLQAVKAQIDNGAAGVAMGRNLWGHATPGKLTAALAAIIHDNASVDAALKMLG